MAGKGYPRSLALKYLCKSIDTFMNEENKKMVDWVFEEFDNNEWEEIVLKCWRGLKYGKQRYGISKDAILACKRIEAELGMKLFPVVIRTYAGSWQLKEGAWSWWMYRKTKYGFDCVGSSDKVKDFTVKRNKIDLLVYFGTTEIFANRPIGKEVVK